MGEREAGNEATRVSFFFLVVIFLALALSLIALYLAVMMFEVSPLEAGYFLIIGFVGLAFSVYMLYQTKRRILRISFELQPIHTVISCNKCDFKNIREFQRGDYIFKEVEPCPKCNEKMTITAIYREVKEKPKEERLG
ncbi:MAG: hypothetical protein QXN63_05140 [Candidatus Bathyarchaeia archaeon]